MQCSSSCTCLPRYWWQKWVREEETSTERCCPGAHTCACIHVRAEFKQKRDRLPHVKLLDESNQGLSMGSGAIFGSLRKAARTSMCGGSKKSKRGTGDRQRHVHRGKTASLERQHDFHAPVCSLVAWGFCMYAGISLCACVFPGGG